MGRKKKSKNTEEQIEIRFEKPVERTKLGLKETYRDYFLQYASYVITDRAIPDIVDGLKPVQRRILHTLWVMEDGRYHKVANVIGHCMQYHPHGDASIGSALVGVGQKELLIDTQGNWGDPVTGDSAAAARYIEARLTKFAKEVLFAPHLTEYKKTYDGRNKEPILLPAKFPILPLLGAEGIAVGLSTKILPHNFIELIEACKSSLRKEDFKIFPDFMTRGYADVSNYHDGLSGSRLKVRAHIEKGPGKDVTIREIPFGTTTSSLIDSIIAAGEKGKIKLAHIEDNTAAEVNITVKFQRGVDIDKAVDALYAFTECEVSHSPNGMVIVGEKPMEMSITDMVIHSANQTRHLLKLDLEYRLDQLETKWHYKSLVQIFIENRIYLRIEKSKTWESVLGEIDEGLKPFIIQLRRPVVQNDLVMLTEVKMRRISAHDAQKAREELIAIDKEIAKIKKDLSRLTQYTINWFDHLLEEYGEGRERKTRLETFDAINAVTVVERTEKLYVDRQAGFVGTTLKNAEEVCNCSTLDDVLVFKDNGTMQVVKVDDKIYVGEKIVHVQVFAPGDREAVFNMVYEDSKNGMAWTKRFSVGGVTRDKEYNLCSNAKEPKVLFFNSEEDSCVFIKLRKKPRIKTEYYFDFREQLVKGRGAGGNVLSKNKVSSVRKISRDTYEKKIAEE